MLKILIYWISFWIIKIPSPLCSSKKKRFIVWFTTVFNHNNHLRVLLNCLGNLRSFFIDLNIVVKSFLKFWKSIIFFLLYLSTFLGIPFWPIWEKVEWKKLIKRWFITNSSKHKSWDTNHDKKPWGQQHTESFSILFLDKKSIIDGNRTENQDLE